MFAEGSTWVQLAFNPHGVISLFTSMWPRYDIQKMKFCAFNCHIYVGSSESNATDAYGKRHPAPASFAHQSTGNNLSRVSSSTGSIPAIVFVGMT